MGGQRQHTVSPYSEKHVEQVLLLIVFAFWFSCFVVLGMYSISVTKHGTGRVQAT